MISFRAFNRYQLNFIDDFVPQSQTPIIPFHIGKISREQVRFWNGYLRGWRRDAEEYSLSLPRMLILQ